MTADRSAEPTAVPYQRDDLDGLYDDETLVEDPNLYRAKAFLFGLVLALLGLLILVLALFFQPEGQVVLEHWPNGYRRTQTNYISAPNAEGRIPHGPHRAWYEDGTLAEQGSYEHGMKVGDWSYWDPSGTPIRTAR